MNDQNKNNKSPAEFFSRRKFIAVAAVGSAALLAPTACDVLESDSDDDKSIQKIIESVVDGDHALKYITVIYTIGLKHWEHGETKLTVKGSGHATVQNIEGNRYVDYQGTVSQLEFEMLMKSMENGKFWNLKGSGKGLPDEAPISVTFSDSDTKKSHTVTMFESEARSDPDFRPIVDKLDQWVRSISNNNLF
jgi:hypothetical protein